MTKKLYTSYWIIKYRNGFINNIPAGSLISKIGVKSLKNPEYDIIAVYPVIFLSKASSVDGLTKIDESTLINTVDKLDSICKDFIKYLSSMNWIFTRYVNPDEYRHLIELALINSSNTLFNRLDDIYWRLPDHIFNLIENPEGFMELLSIVDNDDYKMNKFK